MSTSIYVLRLQGGKYYVGKSDDPQRRFEEHRQGRGAAWTRAHKPLAVEKIIPNASAFDEDKITKEMMSKHGIDNVRGGTYVSIELDDLQYQSVQTEIWAAKNLCTTCGRSGHFSKDCYARTTVDGDELVSDDSGEEDSEEDESEEERPPRNGGFQGYVSKSYSSNLKGGGGVRCYSCGALGHYANSCYSSRSNSYSRGKRNSYYDDDSD
jgi:predicted GIY-YIG superfamily endonuclease